MSPPSTYTAGPSPLLEAALQLLPISSSGCRWALLPAARWVWNGALPPGSGAGPVHSLHFQEPWTDQPRAKQAGDGVCLGSFLKGPQQASPSDRVTWPAPGLGLPDGSCIPHSYSLCSHLSRLGPVVPSRAWAPAPPAVLFASRTCFRGSLPSPQWPEGLCPRDHLCPRASLERTTLG